MGEIDQDGGKGLCKVMTGALKYALMKTFLIPTGDDPERDETAKKPPARPAVGEQSAAVPTDDRRMHLVVRPEPPKTVQQPMPAKKEQPKMPDAATPAQVRCIAKLAAEICLDVEKDLYRPRGISQQPTKAQASSIITNLKATLPTLPTRKKQPTEDEVTTAEREGMRVVVVSPPNAPLGALRRFLLRRRSDLG